ncbi:MAG: hypothetical protein DCC67_10235 [Planctomycetota bacterium]|nr:MAG: hypothetical protein DCC67_10235 [Planctomycetota bacterium]
MMIRQPRWTVQMQAAGRWSARGACAEAALRLAQQAILSVADRRALDALSITIVEEVPPHRGLGSGTQLALAVAAGVRRLAGMPPGTAGELADMVHRGQRSAVGSHGFVHGGLIWESGRLPGQSLGRLVERVAVPDGWRILLVAPRGPAGLSGQSEREAFRRLPPVSPRTTSELIDLAEKEILPAARAADCRRFGEAVYLYGRLAGECFASVQHGAYASPQVADCVAALRQLGVAGVGQSSWGPTVFACVEGSEEARWAAMQLKRKLRMAEYDIRITSPDNIGATV